MQIQIKFNVNIGMDVDFFLMWRSCCGELPNDFTPPGEFSWALGYPIMAEGKVIDLVKFMINCTGLFPGSYNSPGDWTGLSGIR